MAGMRERTGWRRYWPRVLFLLPLIAMLWVPSYNRIEPKLADIPFFYWYQLAWILLGAGIVLVVYLIETRITHMADKPKTDLDASEGPGDIL